MTSQTTDSLSKRERQKERHRRQQEERRRAAKQQRARRKVLVTVGIIVAVAAVLALAFLLARAANPDLGVEDPQVAADAQPLPPAAPTGEDPVAGAPAPVVTGENFAGEPVQLGPGSDQAQAIAFMAHWCPHCQDELPLVADWVADGALPEDVELVGVATGLDPNRPNWPPDEWFEREGWPGESLVDTTNEVADIYGLTGTPYWVFLDADGNVVSRHPGVIGEDVFRQAAAQIGS